ncbi:TBC1 domain family member 8B [Frankliniella fusca]|uniref:TBC1 domain family member 8B n=1 Tax=Frankliniella fusca TaxID=407009 RepID=A0AAE1LE22_9NEOP|nr:TBC1 domain family member 8B [Frankliniella fusca]
MLAPLLTLALLTLALLTLALLPLALAACPCPPAPAAAEVCGSDHKTYPSACDLDCTAPPVSPTSTTSALTTTSPTSTTSTTSAPITISPASPASPAGVHAADVVWERALLVFCALVCACVCVWVCVRARAPHALLCCPVGPVSVHQVACAERSHQEAASARACGASSEPGVELTALELDSQPLCS